MSRKGGKALPPRNQFRGFCADYVSQRTEVFVLLTDRDGTMRSTDEPFGVAVTTEEEAKRFVQEGKVGYSHSYMRLIVFDNKDDALHHD